jgi:hypothetical protein
MGDRYLHLLHSEHKAIRVPLLLWGRWCGSRLRQPWVCVSVLTDALQRLAVHVALGIQMESSGNKLVEQGL